MRRVLALAAALPLTACTAGGDGADGAESPRTLTVLAAASLREPFEEIARDFEEDHPGVTVRLSFGGSSALAHQITSGVPADVFASAAPRDMDTAVGAGRAREPQVFATNHLQIAVPPGNPADVRTLRDLERDGVDLALCQPEVPCGAVAGELLQGQGVQVEPATLEPDVRAVLAKVELDEVDAGLVYVTDVRAAGERVEGIELPAARGARTSYPIARIGGGEHAELATEFVDHVRSGDGQEVLARAGFGPPP